MPHALEQAYLKLFWRLQAQQWENYAAAAGHNLEQTNRAIYELLLTTPSTNPFSGRKAEVWQAVRSRGLVDNHPDVAALRNRLDDWDNYSSPTTAADHLQARLQLANNMRSDVLRLLELRQQLAQAQGFNSYVDLVMASEDLSLPLLVRLINEYLDANLTRAQTLIKQHDIGWSTWFSDLDSLADTVIDYDIAALTAVLLQELGLSDCQPRISILTQPDGFGYAGVLQPRKDCRILLPDSRGLHSLLTLGHELGHALAHLCNRNTGLFLTWTASFDESMAVIMEQIAARLWLSPAEQQLARDLQLLEGVRCSLSFLFELALGKAPQQAEAAYLNYYGHLGLDLGNPAIWALDSFRSIDPVYIHNYVLADLLAQRTLAYLEHHFGPAYHAWGTWLTKNYYVAGREQRLLEIVPQ